jgi:hypothetical protein
VATPATAMNANTSTEGTIRQALEASIHAQEKSFEAQKALLRLLSMKTGEVLNTPFTGPEKPTYTIQERPDAS